MKTLMPSVPVRLANRRRVYVAPANMRYSPGASREQVIPLKPLGEFWSDDELLTLGTDSDTKHELRDGKVVAMPPAGYKHGAVIARLLAAVATHVYRHRLGEVFDGQTGFRLSMDHCFAPDVSFVSRERLKLIAPGGDRLIHGSPDLAVEVLSPSDSITKTEKKIALYLTHGAQLAWMIDPKNKTCRIYRQAGQFELLRGDRILSGNSILPGFRLPLSRIFSGI